MTQIARFVLAAVLCIACATASQAMAAQTETRDHTSDMPQPAVHFRIATFNAYLNRESAGELLAELQAEHTSAQIAAVAEIVQRIRPDILLINEFDYDSGGEAVRAFQQRYLQVSQNGATPIQYPWQFHAPSNTGLDSGVDLDDDGSKGGAADAFGYGLFPGQYGMLLLSRHPIDHASARTFQRFLWRDMPDAKLPRQPENPRANWYSEAALAVFRLSSKSHWDVPIQIDGTTVHVLASHPTPPVFDGPEDRNGLRNHDEIRFWADYVSNAEYIYDDNGASGGLAPHRRFVIIGDLNASIDEGDASGNPIQLLAQHPAIDFSFAPHSAGARENRPDNPLSAFHTANWGLRADYVLPSKYGLEIAQGAVFWPMRDDPLHYLTGHRDVLSSDHRLVWLDLVIVPEP